MKKICALLWLFAALCITTNGVQADAGASDWQITDQTEVRLIAASQTTGETETIQLGVQFRLKPEWKIYWRSPGDAGFPPQMDWSGSHNLDTAITQWPVPKRFSVLGLETLGYKDEVVLPVLATRRDTDQPLDLRVHLRYLTCNDICIPYDAQLALNLPAGQQVPSDQAHLISRYLSAVPGDGQALGLTVAASRATETDDRAVIRFAVNSTTPLSRPDAYFEGPMELAFSKPDVTLSDDRRSAILEVKADGLTFLEDTKGPTVEGREFIVTLVDSNRSIEQKLTIGDPLLNPDQNIPPVGEVPEISLFYILAIAVLGGLILNLMPCVLPVLSIKVLGVVGHGGGENRMVRLSFLASAVGIISSFLVLAAALASLKASGMAIGWGIQFQQPWFLIAMTLLVILFACNLWGFFEIRLPGPLARLGSPAQDNHHLSSHFMQGALATLLATPCSAPFLGTAVGFALARGTLEILVIFLALGLGLALPYLIFALAPSMITRLPRPGVWMVRLRIVLGFALAATAVWLISVLTSSLGQSGTIVIAGAMVLIVIVLFVSHHFHKPDRNATWLAVSGLAVLALVLPVQMAGGPNLTPNAISSPSDAVQWQRFDLTAIPGLVADGNTVLVDVTADWCITCKVNKALVFGEGPVAETMSRSKIIAMQADWTRPDPMISAYLARFGRYGIPFNAVYGPNAPQGQALPELLTTQTVLQALDNAASDKAFAKQSD